MQSVRLNFAAACRNLSSPHLHFCAPVAQLDRASGYEPEGREFDSLRARHSFQYLQFDYLESMLLAVRGFSQNGRGHFESGVSVWWNIRFAEPTLEGIPDNHHRFGWKLIFLGWHAKPRESSKQATVNRASVEAVRIVELKPSPSWQAWGTTPTSTNSDGPSPDNLNGIRDSRIPGSCAFNRSEALRLNRSPSV